MTKSVDPTAEGVTQKDSMRAGSRTTPLIVIAAAFVLAILTFFLASPKSDVADEQDVPDSYSIGLNVGKALRGETTFLWPNRTAMCSRAFRDYAGQGLDFDKFLSGCDIGFKGSSAPDDSSSSQASNGDSENEVKPEATQSSPQKSAKSVDWKPTFEAIRICVLDWANPNCPRQGLTWETNVSGQEIVKKLMAAGFCNDFNLFVPSAVMPAGGEWGCTDGKNTFEVFTGNMAIVDNLKRNGPFQVAAKDGALVYGFPNFPDKLLATINATLIGEKIGRSPIVPR